MNIDVSVLIVSYQPDLEKLKKTVISSIRQNNITHQIVIADDGSKYNYFDEIKNIFVNEHFTNYIFVTSEINNGTCLNIYNGLKVCTGMYVKTIAPGDYFFDENTLHQWVVRAKAYSSDICFGDTVYYRNTPENGIELIKKKVQPQNISIYTSDKVKNDDRILNYIFLKDAIVGSSFLTKKDVMYRYLELIKGRIKYAEDMVYRIMIIDGLTFNYYSSPVIWYEYGTGISTSGSKKWEETINKERLICNEIIKENMNYYGLKKIRICLALNVTKKRKFDFLKYFIFPKLIYWKIMKEKSKKYTDTDIDFNYLYKLD